MFTLILFASSVAVVLAAPPRISGSPNEVPIISQEIVVNGDGSYRHSYESGDGTKVQESGQLKSLGPQEDGEAVQGSFSYIGADGGNYALSYTADENGFVPQAAHLPVAPEIPEAIARSIAYNLAHPEEDTSQKL